LLVSSKFIGWPVRVQEWERIADGRIADGRIVGGEQ
jgi:hypothetical protein